ncbi:MAG: oxidoreductase [Microbacteriaceae bacterium]|nr:oxidoreductase [Microbacteriaceae bacterium]
MLRSAWTTDPFARGSHSFIPAGSTPAGRDDLATPVLGRVFFAGEATSTDLPGTVLGAQASGSRAASQVASVAQPGERIAVIGAGVAGAEAARNLTLAGYNVVVIEARNRVGGRIDSRKSSSWPVGVELGAWRLARQPDAVLLSQLTSLGVQTNPLSPSLLASTSASATADPIGSKAVADAAAWAAAQPTDSSLEKALDKSGAARAADGTDVNGLAGSGLLDHQLQWIATATGADPSALSSWYAVNDIAAYDRVVTGGFDRLVTDALTGVTTSLSTAVAGVSYGDSGVSLKLGTGESLAVDRAVVAVPLGVLKRGSITFDPLLPLAHRSAIAEIGVGTVETVWLRFNKPFWSTDAAAWGLIGTDNDITTWVNLEAITGEPVLVGIVGGRAARDIVGLSDDELIAAAMRSLEPFAEL